MNCLMDGEETIQGIIFQQHFASTFKHHLHHANMAIPCGIRERGCILLVSERQDFVTVLFWLEKCHDDCRMTLFGRKMHDSGFVFCMHFDKIGAASSYNRLDNLNVAILCGIV
mmetsp:Transcript_35219/g.87455  ORF Transcript_35219/g.87455 Transcript_35219/m.87455 type:complete len:113 (+) Transcript_35219:736-1074(+)